MYNTDKLCAYITYFLREEINRHALKKSELDKRKDDLKQKTERRKENLIEYRKKTEQKLQLIKIRQTTPGISVSAVKRLDQMYAEIEESIDETDEKINELYDELDEQTEKIDDQIYEISEKINEINELLLTEEHGETPDEKIIRELEEEISRIDLEIEFA